MIARQNGGRAGNLLIALLGQFFKNLRPYAKARIDLREGMLTVGVPDKEISGALKES